MAVACLSLKTRMKENISLESCCETWPKLECLWCSPPSALIASNDQVHIWRIRLDLPSRQILEMERKIAEQNENSELGRFSLSRIRKEALKALRCQANVNPNKALKLLTN